MAYLLGIAITSALLLASIALYKYGNIQRQHPLVTISVLVAWSFSFLIVFTIPLDVTATVYRQCINELNITQTHLSGINDINDSEAINKTPMEQHHCQKPWGMVPDTVFPNMWRVIYWSSQFLTWLIMPLMQSYLKAGDFTVKGKFRAAVIDNAIYYGSYLFICGVLLIYIALKPGVYLDWQKVKAIASSASNTWGLFLLVLLLGYALVEVPRSLWMNSKSGFTLQYAYFKLSKLSTEKAEAEENVDDVLESLQAASRAVPNNHDLRACVETIQRKVPVELLERAARNIHRANDQSSTVIPSEKSLVRLHKQVIKSLQTLQRTEALWNVHVQRVFFLEDVAKNQSSMERRFKSEHLTVNRTRLGRLFYSPMIDWYWQCMLKPPFLKTLAVATGTLSLMVVWSELTFFNRSPVLSIFANVLNVAKYHYDFLTIEIFSMATLCYLCYCAYSTVFRIKFLNLYYLAPHHQTNEHSLIFSGMLLCRLTPPMCLNFLGLIHMDSHIIKARILETHYTQIMGHMDVLSIISDGFNIYFPMVMLAFCLATWFSLGSRALNALGFQQFMLNETIATELVQEGRDLISREKRRRQRADEAMMRRQDLIRSTAHGTAGIAVDNLSRKYRQSDDYGREMSAIEYGTSGRTDDIKRSLSEEINDRFGVSTQVQIGFRGCIDRLGDSDSENAMENYADDDDDEEIRNFRRGGPPPKRLFDDV